MANLRATMDGILKEYGYNILLQKRVNISTSESKEYSGNLERHTVRSMLPGSAGLTDIAQELDAGVARDAEMVYYFRYTANPDEGDRIYDNYGRSENDYVVFTIDWAVPMRGKKGRIEFWTVGVTREKN